MFRRITSAARKVGVSLPSLPTNSAASAIAEAKSPGPAAGGSEGLCLESAPSSGGVLEVICPPDGEAGALVQMTAPDGQTLQVEVPEGIAPGQAFQVQYTPITTTPSDNSLASKAKHMTRDVTQKAREAVTMTKDEQIRAATALGHRAMEATIAATGRQAEEFFGKAYGLWGKQMESALASHDNSSVNRLLDHALAARFMASDKMPRAMRAAATYVASSQLRAAIKSENPKLLKGALVAAKRLNAVEIPEFDEAVSKYKEVRRLPPGWDVGRMVLHREGNKLLQKLVTTDPAVMAKFQRLLDLTERKVYTRDRLGQPVPDRLKLVSVTAVENADLWADYMARREAIRREVEADDADTVLSEPVETMVAGDDTGDEGAESIVDSLASDFAEPLLPSVNEVFLFHGTSAAAADKISTENYKLNLAGSAAGILYGRGVYLAEHCTKSDEYTKPMCNGDRHLLICRSTLGRVYYTDKRDVDPRACEKACLDGRHHSVLGDRRKARGTFREFVVFDEEQVYPNYILTYRRVGGTVSKTRSCEVACPPGVSPGDTVPIKAPDGKTINVIVPPGVSAGQKFLIQY